MCGNARRYFGERSISERRWLQAVGDEFAWTVVHRYPVPRRGALLRGWLGERYGRTPQFLHGGVVRKERDDMVVYLRHDRTERVFLLSLKDGGTGLNLAAAPSVIHFYLRWNPAVEAQANDRANRIVQRSHVQVHRLITEATFEERINDMIKGKRELAELAVGTGEQWIGNLSDHELPSLLH
ncbi:helicase-related protein [Burkholderia sp. Bp9031]|uniref:helicase-related protein n=1 Tax=Burkholderia sp. Bp9031 TaxID=2184566 RepID=UPI001C8970D6|nr:C-terminal helicase domain-containing protein [Burkholderia sp. Bp9031]